MLEKIKSNWQNILIGFLLLAIFVIGFFVIYYGLKSSKANANNQIISPTESSYQDASPSPLKTGSSQKGTYNVLFLGYGGAGHEGSMLTDSVIVIHIDVPLHKVALISIPRDLWVTGGRKINAEASSLGFGNIGSTIKNVTGLPINYYVAVDFGGFVKIIDGLGGVSVQVPATFTDSFYPKAGEENNTCGKSVTEISTLKAKYSGAELEMQFTCRYEQIHYDKGPANLDGTAALKFVRSRHGDSDFARSLRQFAVLVGIENKLISTQGAGKIDGVIDTFSKLVKTDLNAGIIKTLIQILGDAKVYSTKQVQLTTSNVLNEGKSGDGAFILVPKVGNFNFSEIQTFIKSNIDS